MQVLDLIKREWGTLFTYLLASEFVLAIVIGVTVLWPLALLTEIAVIVRHMDKNKGADPESPHERRTRLRQTLDMLATNRKMLDESIVGIQQELAAEAGDGHEKPSDA